MSTARRSSCVTCGLPHWKCASSLQPRSLLECSRRTTPMSSKAMSTGARCLIPKERSSSGTLHQPTYGNPRSSRICLRNQSARRTFEKRDFNTYGARRGNHEVMVRGTFGNIRLRNRLLPEKEGYYTLHLPGGEQTTIYEASVHYQQEGVPLLVIAGKEYGSGSSRDWAAKGPLLLGIRAAIAESFERIHRSNLVGMGILPLQFKPGENKESLGLTGREIYDIEGIEKSLRPRQQVTVRVTREDGSTFSFQTIARLDSPIDVTYYENGGILPTVLRKLMKD